MSIVPSWRSAIPNSISHRRRLRRCSSCRHRRLISWCWSRRRRRSTISFCRSRCSFRFRFMSRSGQCRAAAEQHHLQQHPQHHGHQECHQPASACRAGAGCSHADRVATDRDCSAAAAQERPAAGDADPARQTAASAKPSEQSCGKAGDDGAHDPDDCCADRAPARARQVQRTAEDQHVARSGSQGRTASTRGSAGQHTARRDHFQPA